MRILRWAFPSFITAAAWFRRSHTIAGMYCVGTVAAGSLLLIAGFPVPVDLVSAMAALLAVCKLIHLAARPACAACLEGTHIASCGSPMLIQGAVTNTRGVPACDLELALESGSGYQYSSPAKVKQPILFPNGLVIVHGRFLPQRRGISQGPPVIIESSFPLSLFRCQQRVLMTGEIIVYPYRPPVQPDWLVENLNGIGSDNAVTIHTDGMGDFAGSCDYRPGLPVRRWDFRSWARINRPVIHQFDDTKTDEVIVYIDTDSRSEVLEKALSLAATAVEVCVSRGMLCTSIIHCHRSPERSSDLRTVDDCLDLLARIDSSSEHQFNYLQQGISNSPVDKYAVFIMSKWDDKRERVCRQLEAIHPAWVGFLLDDDSRDTSVSLPADVKRISWELPSIDATHS